MHKAELILASASPRRAQLLAQGGYAFRVMGSGLEQEEIVAPLPRGIELLALEKASRIASCLTSGVVLGADTAVVCGEQILGKPQSQGEAAEMLRLLSGAVHHVITGVALVDAAEMGQAATFSEITKVWMRSLNDEEINFYIRSGEFMDKAGAYAIQGFAAIFVSRIEGCYANVVGLPLAKVYLHLREMGIFPASLEDLTGVE